MRLITGTQRKLDVAYIGRKRQCIVLPMQAIQHPCFIFHDGRAFTSVETEVQFRPQYSFRICKKCAHVHDTTDKILNRHLVSSTKRIQEYSTS